MDDDELSKTNIYDVIIIGGGPAGLTAGIYTTRARLSTILIEKLGIGGQTSLTDKVENYPGFIGGISGPELVHNMEQQAESFGMRTVFGEVTRVDFGDESNIKKVFVDDDPVPYQCLSIIIAAGHKQRNLGVQGESEFTGKGVSYCATCDGFFFRDREVAVVGGGDTAITDALELTRHVKKVYVIHRRDQLRAGQVLQQRAFAEPKLEFIWNTVVDGIVGEQLVKALSLRNVKTKRLSTLEVAGVFVAVGLKPNSQPFADIVELSETGHIVTNELMATSVAGIFAAGDIRRKSARQIASAVGDGATAALSAFGYLRG